MLGVLIEYEDNESQLVNLGTFLTHPEITPSRCQESCINLRKSSFVDMIIECIFQPTQRNSIDACISLHTYINNYKQRLLLTAKCELSSTFSSNHETRNGASKYLAYRFRHEFAYSSNQPPVHTGDGMGVLQLRIQECRHLVRVSDVRARRRRMLKVYGQ
jgi:hypothetical protein